MNSSGVNNWYEHPHKDTLERLAQSGTKVYNTAEVGQITVTMGEDLKIKNGKSMKKTREKGG